MVRLNMKTAQATLSFVWQPSVRYQLIQLYRLSFPKSAAGTVAAWGGDFRAELEDSPLTQCSSQGLMGVKAEKNNKNKIIK